jgi:hypothetical protein
MIDSVHDEVFSIQIYEIMFVSDLLLVNGLSLCTPISFINKIDHHDFTLKLSLKNYITSTGILEPPRI